jgi:cell division protein FtsI (penicillin-binding protein 3)
VTLRAANRRIRLVSAVLALAFAITLVRAAWVQVVRASSLSRLADAQQTERVTTPAPRGTIDDRNGVELATNVDAITVYADPKLVTAPGVEARKAASVLGLGGKSEADLAASLSDRSTRFVYVARQARVDVAEKIEHLNLKGFVFLHEAKRSYPQEKLAAQLIGYAGVDNHGLSGLEYQYDKVLAGRDGEQTVVRDPLGRVINVQSSKEEQPGANLTLTLDSAIQLDVQQVLARTLKDSGARSASVVVLDSSRGDVLAMATAPSYDANDAPGVPQEYQRNRPVTDNYEPGSTFKLVTIAGALSDGLVTPHTSFTLPYSIRVADKIIHDAHLRGTERLTVAQILAQSSNVGAVTVSQLLGKERLMRWIKRFGFGRLTGIDFPGEIEGTVPPLDHWYGSVAGTIPIGQGIAVTPIQLAAAYAAISNHGVWVQPHLVERIGDKQAPAPKRRRVVSPAVADTLMTMLRNVVVEGTGAEAEVPGYTVAGKTGTAAIPDPKTGGYSDRYVASFVGIVPASKPRLVILVTVDEPVNGYYGGVVAAPAFKEIALDCLRYLEIPPDKAS